MSVPRSALSSVTLAAIGVTACVLADLVHEGLGHGMVSWLTGDRVLSISTVAVQNAVPSRCVAAAGTCANLLLGVAALLILGRAPRLTPRAYFLWVFAACNLFNVGYLVVSAIAGGGDWGSVISGLTPAWLWRLLLALAGAVSYAAAFRWLARFLIDWVARGDVASRDLGQLVWPAYLGGGVVVTGAAMLNPISPWLILVSGLGASFGLNCGLPLLSGFAAARAQGGTGARVQIRPSAAWIVTALGVAACFIGILGPGIRW